ncbi:hypothetical protein F5882DRAFT_304772 [Hyaloscypha sp. PMI_1271]|nr:hypothetical protein F5882DRAFT_304772 [Hyaloscypha sp. PMI_1271]
MALQDNQPLDIWVTVLLLVVPMIALVARVYVRLTNKTFGPDDTLMAVGAFFYVCQCTTVKGGATTGIGLQNEHITGHPQLMRRSVQWFYFNILAYSTAAVFVRLSILATLLRIVSSPGYKYSIYVAIATIIAVALQGIIFLLVQCKPISWYWDRSTGSGSCVSSAAIRGNTIATNFTAAVTDVYSAVLPIILLWNVQMNWRSKFLVCIMLSLGAFASVAIVVRLPAIVDLQDHQDSLYSVSISILWRTAETGIGITPASLSTLRQLFRSCIGTSHNDSCTHSYALGILPGAGGRFRPTVRTDGMARLPDPRANEARKGDNTDVSDSTRGRQYDLAEMNRQGFNAKTSVSANSRLAKRSPAEASEVLHGDSNSETEILDARYRHNGIRVENTLVVESTTGVV